MRRLLLLMLFVCLAAPAASLRVVVRDPSGALVHSAAVRLGSLEQQTSLAGEAVFPDVSPGRVLLSVEADGFANLQVNLNLKNGNNKYEAALTLATRKDRLDVAVDEREEKTDPRGIGFSSVLTEKQIEQLPDDPEEMERVLKDMAGPGATFRIDGFRGGRLPHKSQIASIRFKLTPYSADEHDDGFMNIDIVTKPGLGRWRGSTAFAFGDDSLNARNAFAPVREPQQRRRFDVSLFGPLWRNKTTATFSFTRDDSYDSKTSVGVLPDGPFSNLIRLPFGSTMASGRLQHALTKSQVIRGEYQFFRTSRSSARDFDLPERVSSAAQDMHVLRLSGSQSFREKLVNEYRLEAQWTTSSAASLSNDPAVIVQAAFSRGGAGADSDRRARNIEFADHLNFNKRKHVMRAGFQINTGNYRSRDFTNGNGTFTFPSLDAYVANRPQLYTRRVGDVPVDYAQYQFGGYFQDDIRLLKNFTLSLGLRLETQTGVPDRLNPAPRIGFAWSPFKTSKTVFRGGGGLFYRWYDANTYEESLRLNGSSSADLFLPNPSYPNPLLSAAAAPLLPPSIVRQSPNLNLPYGVRASFSVQQEIFKRFNLIADYRTERGIHVLRARNVNVPISGIRPDPAYGNILQLESAARSSMQGLMVGLSSAPGMMINTGGRPARLFWSVNYFLSKSEDETASPLSPPSNSANTLLDRGPSVSDIRHRFSAMANATLWKGLQIGTFLRANSALPYNITTGFDANGDTYLNDRPAGVGRNSARGASTFDVSTRLSWTGGFGKPPAEPGGGGGNIRMQRLDLGASGGVPDMPMGGGPNNQNHYRLQLYAQAYNLMNHANRGGFVGVLSSPLFGQPTSAQAGRRVELGARLSF